ncbi:lectin-like [Trachinotus anak]|uniref:lectin-like n=1 Tax=Trachinotus anak TaxID=443729 RepID=UPI0039F18CA9
MFLRELIHKTSGSYSSAWIGCYDGIKERTWMWTDGSKFDYQAWGLHEPNNNGGAEHCVEMNKLVKRMENCGWNHIYSDFLTEKPGSGLGPAHHLLAPGVQVNAGTMSRAPFEDLLFVLKTCDPFCC